MLTVPVKVSLNTLIKDVVIDNDQKWSKKHWLSIKYNYSKAPHWDYLAGELENIYNRDWYKLIDLNMEIIHLINNKLDISTKLVKASDLDEDFGKKTELLVNLCKHMNASIFYPGTGCKKYIDQKEFEKYKIKLIFQQFKYPVYPQRFGDFISNLSIIDLLFNCGPNSLNIIRKGRSMDKALEGN
jgi:hypothetical protein